MLGLRLMAKRGWMLTNVTKINLDGSTSINSATTTGNGGSIDGKITEHGDSKEVEEVLFFIAALF